MKNLRFLFSFLCKSSFLIVILAVACACSQSPPTSEADQHIKPWDGNPRYWQYKGDPVLLLGATDNDNLFQIHNLESHLDSLKAIGGNYIRNTMSDRDEGDQRAFAITAEGKYDLNRWNEEYWNRFETLLRLTGERDIIVQIEIWDRFDHSGDRWLTDPYNPKNNINYTYAEAGLDTLYPNPSNNAQHFFSSIPEADNNKVLLKYQTAFMKKMLSVSGNYDNVLYCIDNETTGTVIWAAYWTNFIQENLPGKDIYITQMWNNWDLKSDIHKRTLDHPERYRYMDFSQNSHNTGRLNWDNAQYVFNYIKDNPRPVNSTKIYGNDIFEPWLQRGINSSHAVQTFCRNILGGFAASRFHRPQHGLGLSTLSVNSIKTIRKIEEHLKMWEINPAMDLLRGSENDHAYLAAKEGDKYLIYLPAGGKVKLDLSRHKKKFVVRWINTDSAEWRAKESVKGGNIVELDSKDAKSCFAVVTSR